MGRSAKKLWEEGSSGLMSNLNTLNLIETANEVSMSSSISKISYRKLAIIDSALNVSLSFMAAQCSVHIISRLDPKT